MYLFQEYVLKDLSHPLWAHLTSCPQLKQETQTQTEAHGAAAHRSAFSETSPQDVHLRGWYVGTRASRRGHNRLKEKGIVSKIAAWINNDSVAFRRAKKHNFSIT